MCQWFFHYNTLKLHCWILIVYHLLGSDGGDLLREETCINTEGKFGLSNNKERRGEVIIFQFIRCQFRYLRKHKRTYSGLREERRPSQTTADQRRSNKDEYSLINIREHQRRLNTLDHELSLIDRWLQLEFHNTDNYNKVHSRPKSDVWLHRFERTTLSFLLLLFARLIHNRNFIFLLFLTALMKKMCTNCSRKEGLVMKLIIHL